MGKRIIQQRRGRGTGTYRSPSFRFKGKVSHLPFASTGIVVDLIHCAGHSAPLMVIEYETEEQVLAFASQGTSVGDEVSIGLNANEDFSNLSTGSVFALSEIPEGTLIHNIEGRPGDGGKFVRGSGAFAKVLSKTDKGVRVKLPSKKEKVFLAGCRAAIGVVAGSGRVEKPFLKAGNKFHRMKARNKLYPKVCGISMNAVDHPFGSGSSHSKGRPTLSPRSAPPGRKVGKIAPRRTGRKR